MNKKLIYFFLIPIILTTAYYYFNSKKSDKTPIWHPFKINSYTNFKSLVKAGYSFDNYECGQLVYKKRNNDTIIYYGMYLDYKENEEDITNYSFLNSDQNPYRPFDVDRISNCYERISYKSYWFKIGDTIDLKKVQNFIYHKGGFTTLEDWNDKSGGKAVIYNSEQGLYFECEIREKKEKSGEKYWYFESFRYIPFIDHKREKENLKEYQQSMSID